MNALERSGPSCATTSPSMLPSAKGLNPPLASSYMKNEKRQRGELALSDQQRRRSTRNFHLFWHFISAQLFVERVASRPPRLFPVSLRVENTKRRLELAQRRKRTARRRFRYSADSENYSIPSRPRTARESRRWLAFFSPAAPRRKKSADGLGSPVKSEAALS